MSQVILKARFVWDESLVKGSAFRGFGKINKLLVQEIYESFGFEMFQEKDIKPLSNYTPQRFQRLKIDGVVLRMKTSNKSPYYYKLCEKNTTDVIRGDKKSSPPSAAMFFVSLRRYWKKILGAIE